MKTKSLEILEKAELPSAQARAILQVMEAEFATDQLATKADIAATQADIAETKTEIAVIRAEMATKAELAEAKSEMIRWMFIFWVGQLAATIAIVAATVALVRRS